MPETPNGLQLTLGGAPQTPHTVVGLRGQYRPDRPTPIGGPGEVTLPEAEAAIAAGAPLELVTIPKSKIEAMREAAQADLAAARGGIADARRNGLTGAEADQITDHLDAVKD